MWCQIVRLLKCGVTTYEARIYAGTAVKYRHEEMSEEAARTWLAKQGIPFHKQPRYVAVQRRTTI